MNPSLFLLACGPRTGSTWLQRCLIRNGVMVWGERILIEFLHLMDSRYVAQALNPGLDWNVKAFMSQHDEMWTAVLNPHFRPGTLRAFSDSYFGGFADCLGYDRWGVKETMWHPGWDDKLREAYPDCKILYLTRNFLDCYRSRFSASYSPPVWGSPELDWIVPTDDCHSLQDRGQWDRHLFCRRWSNLTATAFAKQERAHTTLRRYEDLLHKEGTLERILQWAGCKTTEPSTAKIGASQYRELTEDDREIIGCHLGEINRVSERLGYEEIEL